MRVIIARATGCGPARPITDGWSATWTKLGCHSSENRFDEAMEEWRVIRPEQAFQLPRVRLVSCRITSDTVAGGKLQAQERWSRVLPGAVADLGV